MCKRASLPALRWTWSVRPGGGRGRGGVGPLAATRAVCARWRRESSPVVSDTLRDARTEDKYLWHKYHLFRARIGIYGRSDGPADPVNVQALRGKRVGVTNGYDYGTAFDDDPTMVRDVAASDLTSLRKLVAGRVDYALVFDRVAAEIAANNPTLGQGFRLRGVLLEPSLYLSFSKKFPGVEPLIARFDAGLDKIRKNGEYARIEARWR